MKIGKIHENIYKRSIEKLLPKVEASCGITNNIESAVGYFEGTPVDAAKWSVANAFNNLWAAGSRPLRMDVTIVMSDKLREIKLKAVMNQIKSDCERYGVSLTGGHTQSSSGVEQVIVSANAIGEKHSTKKMLPGMDIVMTGYAGAAGSAVIAGLEEKALRERFPERFVEEAIGLDKYRYVAEAVAVAMKSDAYSMQDGGQGGIFGALWEMAENAGVGLEIEMREILFRQETIEICELYGLNPYELFCSGVLLVATKDGAGLCQAMQDNHIPAAVIGKATDSNDRILINGEETRFMEPTKPDQLYVERERKLS